MLIQHQNRVLPAELLEAVIIQCSVQGHPSSVAALAQTCKQLRTLVYEAKDYHLWRNLFLAMFDDPRLLQTPQEEINWQHDFTERVWASKYIQRNTPTLPFSTAQQTLYDSQGSMEFPNSPMCHANSKVYFRMFKTIFSIIQTSSPFTPPTMRLLPAQARSSSELPLIQAHTGAPIFPSPLSSDTPSLNIAWLSTNLARGLPLSIAQIIFHKVPARQWRDFYEGRALCKLTAYLGFLPFPVEQREQLRPEQREDVPQAQNIDVSKNAQRAGALKNALLFAFDIDYPSRHRRWGPYRHLQIMPSDDLNFEPLDSCSEDYDETDTEDDDYGTEDDYGTDSEPPSDEPSNNASASSSSPRPTPVPIQNYYNEENLCPDWTWLACARIVAQSKLRQHVDPVNIAKLTDWDNLREGAWVPQLADTPDEDPLTSPNEPDWKRHKRDWAGAEGIWRRLVCWFGYENLAQQNHSAEFFEADEEWIIVPMTLRITGYSMPPLFFPDRPTIHVKGEIGGADWVDNAGATANDVRRVHGTVRMLRDGSVRWSLTSSMPGSEEDEWSSEAVQLGGVGSAMGSLGMWTGASHPPYAPLGVIWQWRVQ